MNMIEIPLNPFRGKNAEANKRDAYTAFAGGLTKIQQGIDAAAADGEDTRMGSRDWCYYLEQHGLLKPDFDKAELRISNARKWGYLPVDFTLEDSNRIPSGDHGVGSDFDDVEKEMEWIWNAQIQDHLTGYTPINWFDYQPYYVELLVEKRGLGELFKKTGQEFHVSISNGKGDTDIISIANMHRRFQEAEERGQKTVLLYCGDFDPKGLQISDVLKSRFNNAVGQRYRDGTVLEPIHVEVVRFGLNLETVIGLDLSKLPNLMTGGKTGKPLDDPRHPDHFKPYVQDYLALIKDHCKDTGGKNWKVEANAIMVRRAEGQKLFQETVGLYDDPAGVAQYEDELEDAREALREALPEFLADKLAA